ncbi:MAG: hypothetical protein ACRED1_07195 [Limisphaerales bacterium]
MTDRGQTLLVGLAISLGSWLHPLNAPAQGTAFLYQGRLAADGAPAYGGYDMAFALYATNVAGIAVAGPITNSGVAVSNGFFTAALDFGAGVFDGESRWLDIRVSPAGSNSFVELAPRQPVLSAPYAIMAYSASNMLGTVSAAQLEGIIPLGQLPAGVVTNGSSGVALNGNFTGNGSGLADVMASSSAPLSQGEASLDNPTWVQWKASQVDTFNNIGKRNFQHMAARVKAGQTFRLEIDGTGLTAGLGAGVFGRWRGHYH